MKHFCLLSIVAFYHYIIGMSGFVLGSTSSNADPLNCMTDVCLPVGSLRYVHKGHTEMILYNSTL